VKKRRQQAGKSLIAYVRGDTITGSGRKSQKKSQGGDAKMEDELVMKRAKNKMQGSDDIGASKEVNLKKKQTSNLISRK